MKKRKEKKTSNDRELGRHEYNEERDLTRNEYTELQKNNREYVETIAKREKDTKSFYWQGIDPRRRQEFADGGMISEDPSAMANLSQKCIHAQYPKAPFYSTPLVDSLELD